MREQRDLPIPPEVLLAKIRAQAVTIAELEIANTVLAGQVQELTQRLVEMANAQPASRLLDQ